ncbi:helix-turn-helix domain-containing protein [Paenibacillus dendritiformis]|uniref:helix-turn-helix domain-containing protein n=1 Tax=Paenibacillus dendritiformis TaxID=130049 RepID=UPI000DA87353|nr:helix-turn-helix transcriptional regulator [Paenibacillus dendritiformis]PZM63422.1 transcriptional regulator [Paenibacillus dendritiformis]
MKKRQLSPIGVMIKKRLVEIGKTQYELAADVGTSSNYIYLIMIGERSGRSFLPKIAKVLNLNLSQLEESA